MMELFSKLAIQKKEILLVSVPPWGVHNPPLGLAYLSQYLRQNSIRVSTFDFNIELYRRIDHAWHKLWLPENKNRWSDPVEFERLKDQFNEEIDWAVNRIYKSKSRVVGFSVVDPKERMTIEIIKRLLDKDGKKRIVLGGPAVSTPQQRKIFVDHIGSSIDYFVVGEGEQTLLSIMQQYRRHNYCLSQAIETTRPNIEKAQNSDLQSIPFPTFEEFDLSKYDGGSLNVEWSRGCISRCVFCKGKRILGNFRMKKAEKIVEALAFYYRRYGVTYFVVTDNLLNGNVKELDQICNLLIQKRLPIQWEGQGIPYALMTADLLNKMRMAGCCKMQWGLESGSDVLLQRVGKGNIFKVSEAQSVIRDAYRAGIQTELFLIVGFPGENETEAQKTQQFIRSNHKYIHRIKSINTLHLIHGTELYEHAEQYNLCLPETDWHYLWWEKGGDNGYDQRVRRAKALLKLAEECGIFVQEHNLTEGNHA